MKTSGTFLQTERLEFRTWRPVDTDLAHELWGDPRVTRLIDARQSLSRRDTEKILLDHCRWQDEQAIQYWPVFTLKEGVFVGCCGLRPRDADRGVPELGFHVCHDHWGKGYAREAASAVIRHAFLRLGFVALFSGHHPDNRRSERILLSLGFTRTGFDVYPPTGKLHPTYVLRKKAWEGGSHGG